jgi:spore coat polysaccharide biosynthesis predicted glycosyltransferase SpsG/CMP-N-acetylneuraminic acid synthetase
MKPFCVIIPAIKKSVAFPDDLVIKLAGLSLVQRAIDKAKNIVDSDHIYVVTDSEEITLVCERNDVRACYRKDLKLQWEELLEGLRFFLAKIALTYENVIFISAYTPLVTAADVLSGYAAFVESGSDALITLRQTTHRIYNEEKATPRSFFIGAQKEKVFIECRAFLIFRSVLLMKRSPEEEKIFPYILDDKAIEIESYRDWWICEKLLGRKRIVFRVIGYKEIGMGHIFRSLALAHEITDHEIIFVGDEKSRVAIGKIAGFDYLVRVFDPAGIEDGIISLKPDLVINDMLNTSREYILRLRQNDIKVVNFEDLGDGASSADLTINELYDEPLIDGSSIKWGYRYYFLRDEFNDATPHRFKHNVENLLLTFGGTDQHNLTRKVLDAVLPLCRERKIRINIVTGDGYLYKEELLDHIRHLGYDRLEFTWATGVISKIMEKCELAISSNGRTVYELAHMNIPSIIISQHGRELTHPFPCEENGMINVGIYDDSTSGKAIAETLEKLVDETSYRRRLFDKIKRHDFRKNKAKVVRSILNLLR